MRTGAHATKERGLKWLVFEKSRVSEEFRSRDCWITIVLLVHLEFRPADFESTSRVKLWTYVIDTLVIHVLNISEKVSFLLRGMTSMALIGCPMVGEAFIVLEVALVWVLMVVEWPKLSESMVSRRMSTKVLLRGWCYTIFASDLVEVMSDVIEHKLLTVHHSSVISLHPCSLWAIMRMLLVMILILCIVHVLLPLRMLLLLLVVDVSIIF